MKTVKISALSAAILLGGLASTSSWAADGETVVIGLAGPLTGPSARIGKDLENGAQLAIDDINKQHPTIGGKAVTFKLQSEDDQSDPRTAVAVAQRLVDSDVAGVVGHWNTGTSIPAARVYHDAGIAQVAPVATGHAYTQQGFDTSFRVMGHDDDGGQLAGQYAVNTLKAKRIAVIDDRTAFGQGLADQFIKSLEAQGVKIVDRQYVDDKTVDFSAVLTAIRSKNADVIFFGGVDSQAAPLARRIIFAVMLPALFISYGVSSLFYMGSWQGFEALTHFNLFVARIAAASFMAYALGQILDVHVFNRLRQNHRWWMAPTASTLFGNVSDTLAFFFIAFWRSPDAFMAEHWMEIALVDYCFKVLISIVFFLPMYGVLLNMLLKRLADKSEITALQAG